MAESLTGQQDLGELDTLLLGSIKRYEDILALFEAINTERDNNNPSTFDSRGTEILQRQEMAALADHDLITILQEMNPAVAVHLSAHPMMDRRQEIMRQIMNHNRSLLSGINNIKSLLAHEIKEIQVGRTALNGYRQTTSPPNGGILNHAR